MDEDEYMEEEDKRWNGSSSLRFSYPRLYALSNIKDDSNREAWNDNINDWDIKPRRPLNDKETNQWMMIKSNISYQRGSSLGFCKAFKALCEPKIVVILFVHKV
uniref:Uncharacterized protein n=1 Tax=Cucumis melo TaxID=3656 RepID=A0A9I9EBI7_CUCME